MPRNKTWETRKEFEDIRDELAKFARDVADRGGPTAHLRWPLSARIERQRRLRRLGVLIVDELSLVSPEHLELLDALLRAARDDESPFGGVQLVVVGDPAQLPPVARGNQARARLHNRRRHAGRRPVSCALVRIGAGKTRSIARGPQLSTYVFECELWKRLAWTPVVLKQVMRQRDEAFVAVLDAIRAGERRPFPTWPEARPARDAADLPYR